jgi:hypothetical protein
VCQTTDHKSLSDKSLSEKGLSFDDIQGTHIPDESDIDGESQCYWVWSRFFVF